MKSFKGYHIIQEYENIQDKQKAWLLDYEGLNYSMAIKEKHKLKWKENWDTLKYSNEKFRQDINMIARKPNRLVIEFDDNPIEKARENLEKVYLMLKEKEIGFIRSTHKGKTDYLWIEFTRDLTTEEGKLFLDWIAPKDSTIDLNFTSDKKVFPILFAKHWKHSTNFEEPIEFHEGNQIDYDKLGITKKKVKTKTITKNGFNYQILSKGGADIFTKRGQVESFWKEQPFFYDKAKIFWIWDKENYTWVMSDEVEFCNKIYDSLGIDTINLKEKGETIEGFKQIGRKHKPLSFKNTWVQFKDRIYDIKTGDTFEASPDYFGHNPIPWKVGESENIPTIDRLFSEWVDKDYVKSLYEVLAYSMSSNQFMQRIISLCGGGSNGKGSWLKLLLRFLGDDNSVSSEIRALSEDKFEPAVLYGKILCIMGEVSHDDLKNTNILKKISGEDRLSYQFKGKTPFTDDNTATCICATNSMPITPDKSVGFYRRWFIIDFPNQFKEMKGDIIAEIPEIEFENLAKKSLRTLKELYDNPKFTNEGDFEHREKRYEERSNPVMRFIEEKCREEPGILTPLRHFANVCNQYLKDNHLRVMNIHQMGKTLRDEGFQVSSRGGVKSIMNISPLKTTKTTKTTTFQTSTLRKETISEMGGLGGLGGSQREMEVKQ